MALPTTPSDLNLNEWEIVTDDDGFVYRRKKRRLDPAALARPDDPAPDPKAEERAKRRRKMRALLELKDKYGNEASQWELLSNTLRASEERCKSKLDGLVGRDETEVADCGSGSESVVRVDNRSGPLLTIERLLQHAEALEALLNHFSHICDAADALSDDQERKTKQKFLDLPIWDSPRKLMASLSED